MAFNGNFYVSYIVYGIIKDKAIKIENVLLYISVTLFLTIILMIAIGKGRKFINNCIGEKRKNETISINNNTSL